jgi:hypothetical protein
MTRILEVEHRLAVNWLFDDLADQPIIGTIIFPIPVRSEVLPACDTST